MEFVSRPCVVLCSWPVTHAVEPLVKALMAARLAACVHVGPAGTSTYRWQGVVETADERPLTIKTTRDRLAAAEACVRAHHPYDVPEWLVVDVTGSEAYLSWLVDSALSEATTSDTSEPEHS